MVEGKERRWIWIFALAVLAVTTLPYLAGYWVQGDQWRFLGFIFGVEDGNSYIAKMLSGAAGDWLFRTPYTAYPQNGAFAFFPYLLLGKLSFPPAQHEQLVFLFQVFRWVGGILLAFATYDFAALFIKAQQNRRWATAVILLGGGLGWLSPLGLAALWQGRIPLEFYSPETFGFLSLMGLPHLEVARACLLWGIRGYLMNRSEFTYRRAALAGATWLVMGLFQPLTVLIGWIVIGIHVVVVGTIDGIKSYRQQRKIRILDIPMVKTAVVMVLISAPIGIYSFLSFNLDPFLRSWTAQNLILSPPVGDYILAFIGILPLTVYGLYLVFKAGDRDALLLGLWVCLFPILAYAPYNLQRRLPEGVWVAVVILAFVAVERGLFKLQRAFRAYSVLSFLPALFFFVGAFFTVLKPAQPLFIQKSEVDAFNALAQTAAKDDVVLASFLTANQLPAWAPLRTVLGHGPESINAAELKPEIDQFFSEGGSDSARQALIDEFNIRFVILSPDEQQASSWRPDQSSFSQLIFDEGSYKVYRILK